MGSLGGQTARKKAMWLYPKVLGFNPSERWGHSACYSHGIVYVFGVCIINLLQLARTPFFYVYLMKQFSSSPVIFCCCPLPFSSVDSCPLYMKIYEEKNSFCFLRASAHTLSLLIYEVYLAKKTSTFCM